MKRTLCCLLAALTLLLSACSFRIEPPNAVPPSQPAIETPSGAPSDAPSAARPTEPPVETVMPPVWEKTLTNVIRGMEKSDFLKGKANGFTFLFDCGSWDEPSATAESLRILAFLNHMGQQLTLKKGTIAVGSNLTRVRRTDVAYLPNGKDQPMAVYDYFSILPVFCSEELDYGYVYGQTALYCEEQGLCSNIQPVSDDVLAEFFSDPENSYVLDLNLPMLEGIWVDEPIAACARSAAVSLTRRVMPQELHYPTTDDAYQQALLQRNQWLSTIGCKSGYGELAYLPFVCNFNKRAEDYPYILHDSDTNWYFRTENLLEEGYSDFLLDYFMVASDMHTDFADARELLKEHTAEVVEPVDIYTAFQIKNNAGAVYDGIVGIVLYHNWDTATVSILHEYIHYLLPNVVKDNKCMNEALTECLAKYYCTNHGAQSFYLHDPQLAQFFRNANLVNPDGTLALDLFIELEAWYDASTAPGESSYLAISGEYIERPEVMTFARLTYSEAASMANFMLDLYGWDAVMAHSGTWEELNELWGKPFLEVYADWKDYNNELVTQSFIFE